MPDVWFATEGCENQEARRVLHANVNGSVADQNALETNW